MRDLTPDTITNAFAEYAKNAPSARTRELLVGLAGHLHGFVRENKVTQAEWGAAIDAIAVARAGPNARHMQLEIAVPGGVQGMRPLPLDLQNNGTPAACPDTKMSTHGIRYRT